MLYVILYELLLFSTAGAVTFWEGGVLLKQLPCRHSREADVPRTPPAASIDRSHCSAGR
jgi:hypothetical protein